MQDDIFGAPPEGAVQSKAVSFLIVNYSALKTPAQYVAMATPEMLKQSVLDCKLGFHYYDSEAQTKKSLFPFTFCLLEMYSAISGAFERSKDEWVNYWSNRVLDTRVEPFLVFEGNDKRPICNGLYSNIKDQLPQGAKFHLHAVAYCIELDRVVEIKFTQSVGRAIQRAISEAEQNAGRKSKPDSINLFSIAQTEYIWAFKLETFTREDKEGKEYKAGELFFAPKFKAGVLPQSSTHFATCNSLRSEIRKNYEDRKAKLTARSNTPAQNLPPADIQTQVNRDADRAFANAPAPQKAANDWTSNIPTGNTPPDVFMPSMDDLPF